MINIEQITSRLAKMPDQSLQQYAMMHKGDPYIMALAMSESKRRKDMRASAQAGPAQAQPKVVDQALMDMAPQAAQIAPQSPDEAGIASLPAGDMNFADGGIVAFADGGGVERYADEGLVRLPNESFADFRRRMFDMELKRQRESNLATEQAREAERTGLLAARGEGSMVPPSPFFERAPLPSASGAAVPTMPTPGYTRPGMAKDPRLETPVTEPFRPSADLGSAKPKAEAGLGGTKEAAAARGSVGPSVEDAKKLSGQFLDTKTLRSDLDKFYKDEEAATVAARARQKEGKPTGEAFSKYEELLKKEEAGAGKEKDEARDVAIFRLGIGMMAGTSPNAFKNIGDAAGVAMTEYSGAIKDMKKAAKERQKAFGEIEQARRAESRDDWKTAQTFEDKADARMAKAREFGVKGIMDLTGKDAEIASGIYKTQVEQKGRMDVAQVQAAAMKDRGAAGLESKEITAAEAAFARDPQAKALSDALKMLALNPESPKYKQTLASLQAIRADKYKQFGITLEGAPGAARPGGTSTTGWGKAQVITP